MCPGACGSLERRWRFCWTRRAAMGNLERALGRLVELLGKHNGPLMPDGRTMWSLLEVVLDGPSSEAGVFQRPAALDHHGAPGLAGAPGEPGVAGAWAKQHFVFTPFARMCAKLWLQRHGRRFGAVAKPRSDKGVARDPQVGTCAAIVASRRAATKALVAQAAAGQAGDANHWRAPCRLCPTEVSTAP